MYVYTFVKISGQYKKKYQPNTIKGFSKIIQSLHKNSPSIFIYLCHN